MSRRSRLGPAWVLVAAAASGCLSAGGAAVRSAGGDGRAEVVYEVAREAALPMAAGWAARQGEPSILPAGYSGGDEEAAPGGPARGVRGRLELIPSEGRVLARVSLYVRPPEPSHSRPPAARPAAAAGRRVKGREAVRSQKVEKMTARPAAVYELELPAAELDLVLGDLDATGALSVPERPGGGARLTVGPGSAAKEWTPEPRLDDLAERVTREGREVPRRLPRGTGAARVRASEG